MKYLETVVHMIVARTIVYLSECGYEDVCGKFPGIQFMVGRLTQEDVAAWVKAGDGETFRYTRLLEIIGDTKEPDHVLQSVLDLCLAQMYAPEFAALLKYHTGTSVTLKLAYGLEGIKFPDYEDICGKAKMLSAVCPINWELTPVLSQDLHMDDRIFAFLTGDSLSGKLPDTWFWVFDGKAGLHPLFTCGELAKRGAKHLQVPGHCVRILGRGGRRFIAQHISALLKKTFVFAQLKDLGSCQETNFTKRRMEFFREALLLQGGLCLYGISRENLSAIGMSEKALMRMLVDPILKLGIPLILCGDEDVWMRAENEAGSAMPQETPFLVLNIPEMDYYAREKVWRGFSGLYGIDLDSARLAERYKLSPKEIASVLRLWRERYPDRDPGEVAAKNGHDFEFSRLCYDALCIEMTDQIGRVIYPDVHMEDLKVSAELSEMLGQVISSVEGRHKIYEEWQLRRKYPYGRAVTVLLTGPPGTGKTMSAHGIASRLGIPLYQVNLSNVVDKYIGETEKHLEQAFSFAEKTGMVLFFDEADSLFGKRSEVKDAKDKYANTEISYLLQRIEQFDGIAVMATNFLENIDTAFLRRIKYVLRFSQPDEKQRLQIWESCILPEVPAQELDLEYLARQFEFSGGTIKNILLNACAIAVYEDGPLTMRHILKAIRSEYMKVGRLTDSSMWGEYADLLLPS